MEAFTVYDELAVIDERHAVRIGEGLSAGTDEVDVGALLKDQTGGADGIAEALDAGNAACAESGTFHEQGVELDAAFAGKEGTPTGVEGVVVFEDGYSSFNRINGGGAASEERGASLEGGEDACFVGGTERVRDGPGAAVDEQNGLNWHHPYCSEAGCDLDGFGVSRDSNELPCCWKQ